MKLRSILITSILTIPALFPSNVKSNTVSEQHRYLAQTIRSLGVPVTINTKIHCSKGLSGSYFSSGFMVICQDNGKNDGKEVEWTANDLDTLRHESHHLLQDCAVGRIGDGKESLMFNNQDELANFVANSGYTKDQLIQMRTRYQKAGITGYDFLMELEAFAVANSIPANMIADKLKEYCSK